MGQNQASPTNPGQVRDIRFRIVVLSTQRSGTSMVCDDLAGTGLLGAPGELVFRTYQKIQEFARKKCRRAR